MWCTDGLDTDKTTNTQSSWERVLKFSTTVGGGRWRERRTDALMRGTAHAQTTFVQPEVGKRKFGTGSWEPEVGETGSRKPEVGQMMAPEQRIESCSTQVYSQRVESHSDHSRSLAAEPYSASEKYRSC